MRREDRRIASEDAVKDVLRRAQVLHLAMVDSGRPYVLPLSYGYDGEAIYLHSAAVGRKVDVLRSAPGVCFSIHVDTELIRGERPCGWGFRYRSVIGEGTVTFVEDIDEKRRGLDALMRQHDGECGEYPQKALDNTMVLRLDISSLSGKQAG